MFVGKTARRSEKTHSGVQFPQVVQKHYLGEMGNKTPSDCPLSQYTQKFIKIDLCMTKLQQDKVVTFFSRHTVERLRMHMARVGGTRMMGQPHSGTQLTDFLGAKFYCHMPLLTATSAFGLGKMLASPQQCYLHNFHTKTDTRLMVSFQNNLGKLAPEMLNQSGF